MKIDVVSNAEVSLEKAEAVVTFDDAKASANALKDAATKAGYPSKLKQP